jgi:hypothetical protein
MQFRVRRYVPVLFAGGAVAGLAMAFRAQQNFPKPGRPGAPILVLCIGAAVAAVFLSYSRWSQTRVTDARATGSVARAWTEPLFRALLALAGIALAVRVYADADYNSLSTRGAVWWLLSIALLCASFSDVGALRRPRLPSLHRPVLWEARLVAVGLVGAAGMAAILLLFRLHAVPREMTSDVIVNVIDAESAKAGRGLVYYPYSDGAVFVYASALISKVMGGPADFVTVKLAGAFAAILAVPVTFLLAREAFGNSRLALIAAVLVGCSHWPVLLARSGYRLSFTPLLAALVFWLLLKAMRTRRRTSYILCGIALGLSLYSYTPVRMLPLLALGCLGLSILSDAFGAGRERWRRVRQDLVNLVVLFGVAVMVVVPLARYAIDRPNEYWRQFIILGPSTNKTPLIDTVHKIFGNLKEAALMFNWVGDVVWTNNIPYSQALDDVMAVLLPVGICLAAIVAVKERRLVPIFLGAGLLAMMLPSVAATANPGDNPSFGRASGAIPFVFTFCAIAVEASMATIENAFGQGLGKPLALLALAGTLAIVISTNFSWYFADYPDVVRTHSLNHTEMASAVRDFVATGGATSEAFVVGFPGWADYRGVGIDLGQPRWPNGLTRIEDASRDLSKPGPKLYLLNQNDAKSVAWLTERYPDGRLEQYKSTVNSDHDFLVFLSQPVD